MRMSECLWLPMVQLGTYWLDLKKVYVDNNDVDILVKGKFDYDDSLSLRSLGKSVSDHKGTSFWWKTCHYIRKLREKVCCGVIIVAYY